MITQEDKNIFRDVGREYLLDIVFDSKIIKNKLTFKEHLELCETVMNLSYEEVIDLTTVNESVRSFEKKFADFLNYSFSAIAGSKSGMFSDAPPLSMFVLYKYRKLNDACSRTCDNERLISKKRKICRYQCQLNTAKKITNELKKEINKCKTSQKPKKCEKSIYKEHIKWAKRTQLLAIKLQRANLDQEEKLRRKKGKVLSQKAKMIASSLQVSPTQLLKIVSESHEFRQNFSFREHVAIYNSVKKIKELNMQMKAIKINPKKEKIIRKALFIGLFIFRIPFLSTVVNYVVSKYNMPCLARCGNQKEYPKKLCYYKCSYLSAKYATQFINKEISKCSKANKPVKCKKKLLDLMKEWKQKEVESKIKLDYNLKKFKEKEGKR